MCPEVRKVKHHKGWWRKRALDYKEYMQSAVWRERREACLERAGWKCEVCKYRKARQAHHLTYVRFKNELPEDLMALCRVCHLEMHLPPPWMKKQRWSNGQRQARKELGATKYKYQFRDIRWLMKARKKLRENPGDSRAQLAASYERVPMAQYNDPDHKK